MATLLKPGRSIKRLVPTRVHDARVVFKTGELEVTILNVGDEAVLEFRVKGTRTRYQYPVDAAYRRAVIGHVNAKNLEKARKRKDKKAQAKLGRRTRRPRRAA